MVIVPWCVVARLFFVVLWSILQQSEGGRVPVPCSSPVDVAFLLDSSSPNGAPNYANEKRLAKFIAKRLGISASQSRAAIILYGDSARIEAHFGDHRNGEYFDRTVNSLPRKPLPGSRAGLAKAFKLANDVVFAAARTSVRKVALLLSSRLENHENDGELENEVKELRKDGVQVLAVGFGNDVHTRNLSSVTDSEEDVFLVRNFSGSKETADVIVERACPNDELDRCPFRRDIVFVMDSSGSLGTREYKKEKYFVNRLAQSLRLPSESRAAVVLYSNTASVAIPLDDTENFQAKVHDLPYVRGKTRTDEGLRVAIKEVAPYLRPDAARLALVFVNGRSHAKAKDLEELSDLLRREGVQVIAVGIGATTPILRSMVTSPSDIIHVKNPDTLISQEVIPLARHICLPALERCERQMEVVFVMDCSDSIGQSNFEKQKSVIKLLTQRLQIDPDITRLALITANSSAEIQVKLDQDASADEVLKTVKDLQFPGGGTRVDLALQLAQDFSFSAARPGVERILVVFTDGHQSMHTESKTLKKAAEGLHRNGVRVLVVGSGTENDQMSLASMVESKEDLLLMESFGSNYELLVEHLYGAFCKDPQSQLCQYSLDVVFVMDSSGSIGYRDYNKEKNLIKTLAKRLGIQQGGSRAGIVVYDGFATVEARFDQYPSAASFLSAVRKLPYKGGQTRLDKALALSHKLFEKARAEAPKLAIVLTDGRQTRDPDTKNLTMASAPLKRDGIHIVAAGVGDADWGELRLMTDSDEDVFFAEDFGKLASQAENLALRACGTTSALETDEISSLSAQEVVQDARTAIAGHFTGSPDPYSSHKIEICEAPMDVVFVVDSFADIPNSDQSKGKAFFKYLTRNFNTSTGHSRIAIIPNGGHSDKKLSDFNLYTNPESLSVALDNMTVDAGSQPNDKVVEHLSVMLLAKPRPKVGKVVILLVCSKNQNQDADAKDLQKLAEGLRTAGIRMFAVGVGDANMAELRLMTGSADNVFYAKSFDDLESIAGKVAKRACFIPDYCARHVDNDCHQRASCITTASWYKCSCLAGYAGNGTVCADLDECADDALNNCHADALCTNTEGHYTCLCKAGYVGDGVACSDVDECADSKTCDENALCYNSDGSFTCECKDGYTGNETSCEDVDECADSKVCHENALCYNSDGSFTCECKDGYTGNETSCEDVDECADANSCHVDALCVNTNGSYSCGCKQGYTGDGQSCADTDECAGLSPCDVNSVCNNADGSYSCECNEGYAGDGVTCAVAVCTPEEASTCSDNSLCSKKGASHFCRCKDGYSSDDEGICVDVDECKDDKSSNCHTNATCMNSGGNYFCECTAGYQGDGVICTDLNECEDFNDCDIHATCNNTDGSYFCECSRGFVGDGWSCKDSSSLGNYKADVVFLMDSSSAVKPQDYSVQKEFVKTVAAFLNVKRGMSRAAVFSYGWISHQAVTFQNYDTYEDFKAGVDNAQYNGGQRRIRQVLERAANLIAFDSRQGVPEVIVLIVGGSGPESAEYQAALIRMSRILRKRLRASTFVVFVGSGADPPAWVRSLVGRASDVLEVTSFDSLVSKAEQFAVEVSNS